jgi:hypothetical protein
MALSLKGARAHQGLSNARARRVAAGGKRKLSLWQFNCYGKRHTALKCSSTHTLGVLVVEDDFLVRYDIAGCLREAGYAVIEIASGEESHPAPFGDGQSLFWKVDAWLFHLFFGKRLKTIADFGSRRSRARSNLR